jgi:DeoR C terminal sensor domain
LSCPSFRRSLSPNLLRCTHGGAASIEPLFYEPFKKDRSFQAQIERQANEKLRIGRVAASLIAPGQTIAITRGTTTAEIIWGIPLNSRITVELLSFEAGADDWIAKPGLPTNICARVKTRIRHKAAARILWNDEFSLNLDTLRGKIGAREITFTSVANWRICDTSVLQILITAIGISA